MKRTSAKTQIENEAKLYNLNNVKLYAHKNYIQIWMEDTDTGKLYSHIITSKTITYWSQENVNQILNAIRNGKIQTAEKLYNT